MTSQTHRAAAGGEADPLPAEAWLVALASLPKMGPARLLAITLLAEPADAWVLAGNGGVLDHPGLTARMGTDPRAVAALWRTAAASADVAGRWADHHRAGVVVAARGSSAYPAPLATDVEPPAVVFMRGQPGVLDGPRVAVVGTRACTRYGFEVAEELGRDLAAAGVRVVSGLALGIDGAAHRGALDALAEGGALPVGVVASGLDIVYPKAHRALWDRVATDGLLLSECPLGTLPEGWRFPARNRIIAALADAVVVVESAGAGGSMYTVDQALRRDIPVMAVPGPVRSAASAGTNRLLTEGATPVRDATDVLFALGISAPRRRTRENRPPPQGDGRRVLGAMGWQPVTLEQLASRTGLAFGPLSVAVAALEADGWVAHQGLWLERVARPR